MQKLLPYLLFSLVVLLGSSFPCFGQKQPIQEFRRALNGSQGWDAAEIRLKLANKLIEKNELREAEQLLKEAESSARENNWVQLIALSLHEQGKLAFTKSRLKRARKLFIASNEALKNSENKVLYMQNIVFQIRVAQLSNDIVEEGRLQQILSMNLRNKKSDPNPGPTTQKKESEFNPLEEGAKRLTIVPKIETPRIPKVEFSQLIDEAGFYSDSLQALNRRNAELAERVTAQKEELSQLTEEQMRQQMELALQQRLLDSMSIKGLQDSVAFTRQQVKLEKQAGQRNILLVAGGATLLFLLVLLWRFWSIRRYNKLLQSEQKRSDDLLLNILPKTIAEELKEQGAAKARKYEQVTVLFSDFMDFSKKAKQMEPQELVEELDYCFRAFDQIIHKYRLEKIKTIGDAYMCAGGIPDPDPEHPKRVILAAAEMQTFLEEWKLSRSAHTDLFFEARIGIHTGPLVAGVVGSKKFAYDIWGSSVNIAARMETNSEPGRINISENTYQLVKNDFPCTPRGRIPIKNLGEIEMYFVEVTPHPSEGAVESRHQLANR